MRGVVVYVYNIGLALAFNAIERHDKKTLPNNVILWHFSLKKCTFVGSVTASGLDITSVQLNSKRYLYE